MSAFVKTKARNMPSKVRTLQLKLYHSAKQTLDRKFGALYDKIYRTDVLYAAWNRVRKNKGASGYDRQSMDTIEGSYKVEFAGHIFLDFRFLTLKLKNLKVREYLRSSNSAILVLAAKMDLSGEDVAKIKAELLRKLFNTVRKNGALSLPKCGLFYQLGAFLDSYIDDKNDEIFKREIEEIKRIRRGKEGKEVGRLIEYLTQGSHEKGMEKGLRDWIALKGFSGC